MPEGSQAGGKAQRAGAIGRGAGAYPPENAGVRPYRGHRHAKALRLEQACQADGVLMVGKAAKLHHPAPGQSRRTGLSHCPMCGRLRNLQALAGPGGALHTARRGSARCRMHREHRRHRGHRMPGAGALQGLLHRFLRRALPGARQRACRKAVRGAVRRGLRGLRRCGRWGTGAWGGRCRCECQGIGSQGRLRGYRRGRYAWGRGGSRRGIRH